MRGTLSFAVRKVLIDAIILSKKILIPKLNGNVSNGIFKQSI